MTTHQPAALPELLPITGYIASLQDGALNVAVLEYAKAYALAALQSQPAAAQGVIAWAHPDGRVVPASTKESAPRDGGAMASSLAGYTIPCVAAQPAAAGVSDAEILALAALNLGPWVDTTLIAFARAILALRPQAESSDQQIREAWFAVIDALDEVLCREWRTTHETLLESAVGAIRSLRPQAVPMTGRQARLLSREELADCCGGCASNSAIETWMRRAIAKFCEVNGITAQGAQAVPMRWPKARDVGRFGDMDPMDHMRVGLDSDNDVYVSVWGKDGGASVEFCNPGGGGGGSSRRTREALIALMVAMEADNADRPDKDWWARRNGITAPGAQDGEVGRG